MTIDFSSPMRGMQDAEARVERTASRIARGPFQAPDSMDLSTEMVNLIQARNDFKANIKVAETMDEMSRTTLHLIG
jgi:flagellar basal body rod protein FlgC